MPLPLLPTAELDLTRTDRQSLLARLQTLAYQVIPQWGDFSPAHPENLLLETQALIGGMVFSVINERARQWSWATLTDRLAAIRKARESGYVLSSATPAQVEGTFYLPNSVLATKVVTLPLGLRLQSGGYQFQLTAASTIAIGNNASASLTVENSETQDETYTSDEQPNQILQLANENAMEDSDEDPGHFYVNCGDGQYFDHLTGETAKLRSFKEAGPDDRVFVPLIDQNGRVLIYFGNGINGAIPQGSIDVQYKTGGGVNGRVGAGATDWKVLDTVYDSDGNAVTVLFQNPAASVGGYDATTVDEARVRAPLALRTLERATINEDFEFAATTVGGIARAAALTSNQDSTILENRASLYLVAYGSPYSDSEYYPPAAATSAQITAVAAAVHAYTGTYKQLMGFDVDVYTALFQDITVSVHVYKASGYSAAAVKANITTALQKYFAVADNNRAPNSLIDFGYKLLDADGDPDYKVAWSGVLNAINDTEGVREIAFTSDNLLLNGIRQSVVLGPAYFPRLSTITVYDDDQGGIAI